MAECFERAIPAELPQRHGKNRVSLERAWKARDGQLGTEESICNATKAVNGVPAIQRDGQSVLSICDQNWDFANWLCALLNELGHMPELLLTEHDREWLNANDRAFRRTV
jgi:hypothetical protein